MATVIYIRDSLGVSDGAVLRPNTKPSIKVRGRIRSYAAPGIKTCASSAVDTRFLVGKYMLVLVQP